jgi:hypothetical protein
MQCFSAFMVNADVPVSSHLGDSFHSNFGINTHVSKNYKSYVHLLIVIT